MLLLNNAMLVGFHVFTGAKSEHGCFRFLGFITKSYSLEYFERQWRVHGSVPGSHSGHW